MLEIRKISLTGRSGWRRTCSTAAAEVAGEADLVRLADGLVAEDQHAVVEQGAAEPAHGLGVERQAEVQSPDLRAQGAAGRDHLDLIGGVFHGGGRRHDGGLTRSLLRLSGADHSAVACRVRH